MTTIEQPIHDALVVGVVDEPMRPRPIVGIDSAPNAADRSSSTRQAVDECGDGSHGLAMQWSWVDGSLIAHRSTTVPRSR
jgi:hypothetical protein